MKPGDLPLFNHAPFLTPDESQDFYQRVLNYRPLAQKKSPHYHILGYPLDYARFINHFDQKAISSHQQMMTQEFAPLLVKTKDFFEELFGLPTFFDTRLGYPGFNIFTLEGNSQQAPFFHRDQLNETLMKLLPELGIRQEARTCTFTVLLSEIGQLTAGLSFFEEQDPLGQKVLSLVQSAHYYYLPFAKTIKYQQGEMNFHLNPTHSLFAKNNGPTALFRVTYQGHAIETSSGLLIYW